MSSQRAMLKQCVLRVLGRHWPWPLPHSSLVAILSNAGWLSGLLGLCARNTQGLGGDEDTAAEPGRMAGGAWGEHAMLTLAARRGGWGGGSGEVLGQQLRG